MRILALLLLSLVAAHNVHASRIGDKSLGWPGETLSGNSCYGRSQGYGPFDYLKSPPSNTGIVYLRHFTPSVEQLRGGESGRLDGDLDYTLRAIPNQHRALYSYARYYLRENENKTKNEILHSEASQAGNPPPECYFHRARAFAPEDGMIPAVFGIYLHKRKRYEDALKQYQMAEKAHPKHAEIKYNIGLLLFDMKRFDESKKYADAARALGYPLRGLSMKLKRTDLGKAKPPAN